MAEKSNSEVARVAFLWVSNAALAAAGVACLFLGVITLWQKGDLAAAGTGLTAGLVFLLASSIERFEVLKGLGVEARTRKLDDAITQANATVEQLRDLAAAVSQVALTELMSSSFFDGATLSTRLSLHDKLLATLKKLDLSNAQMEEADSNWRKGIGVIYHRIIHHHLAQREKKNNVNFQAPKESLQAAKDFQALLKFDEWAAPTPEAMEAFISERNLMTLELQDWINDYKHFIANGEIRRVDKFAPE